MTHVVVVEPNSSPPRGKINPHDPPLLDTNRSDYKINDLSLQYDVPNDQFVAVNLEEKKQKTTNKNKYQSECNFGLVRQLDITFQYESYCQSVVCCVKKLGVRIHNYCLLVSLTNVTAIRPQFVDFLVSHQVLYLHTMWLGRYYIHHSQQIP